MSHIRIIKGKLTEIVRGEYNMYAKENITFNSKKLVTETGVEKGVSYGDPEYPPLAPQPIKLIIQFRPHKGWKGEFGFDWIRLGDTILFRDVAFKDVVAYQYTDADFTLKEMGINAYSGYFKTDETMFHSLKNNYSPFTIPWKAKKDPDTEATVSYEYYVPWLSLMKDKEAKITFFAEIEEDADYLEFSDSEYFIFTPNKINTKGKKRIALDTNLITIKCIKEFTTDQTIELKAFKKDKTGNLIEAFAGKLKVWANDISKQKIKDVVLVEIRTPAIFEKKLKPNISDEKDSINRYLGQAYIKLSDQSHIVELDLSGEADFMNFITNGKIDKTKTNHGVSLQDYLKSKLEEQYKEAYKDHFKAFYFAESGYDPTGDSISGYSEFNANYVVLFSSKNNQTATHEFLHSMLIPHTFTNQEASPTALFTYKYRKTDNLMDYSHHFGNDNKRCSLFYWQWKQANNSIT